jgi:hypothetical protein
MKLIVIGFRIAQDRVVLLAEMSLGKVAGFITPDNFIPGYPLKAGQCMLSTPSPHTVFALPRSGQSGHGG